MERITFVIEFEDGKAPPVRKNMEAFGGKVVSVAFHDALSVQEEPHKITISPMPLNGTRCMLCGGLHSVGVACPLNSIVSVVRDA